MSSSATQVLDSSGFARRQARGPRTYISARQLAVLVDVPDRSARVAGLVEQRGQVVVRLGELGVERERLAVELDRLGLAARILREHAEVVEGGRLLRIQIERAVEAVARGVGIARLGKQPAE